MDNFQIIREIGHGSFAVVYEAKNTASGTHVAIKRLK